MAEDNNTINKESLQVKVYLTTPEQEEIRRFTADEVTTFTYTKLTEKLTQLFPSLDGKVYTVSWKDADGDVIIINNDEDLRTAVEGMQGESCCKLMVAQGDDQADKENEEAKTKCNGCNDAVQGTLYKCLVCPELILCQVCEKDSGCENHNMLKIVNGSRGFPRHLLKRLSKMQAKAAMKQKKQERKEDTEMSADEEEDWSEFPGHGMKRRMHLPGFHPSIAGFFRGAGGRGGHGFPGGPMGRGGFDPRGGARGGFGPRGMGMRGHHGPFGPGPMGRGGSAGPFGHGPMGRGGHGMPCGPMGRGGGMMMGPMQRGRGGRHGIFADPRLAAFEDCDMPTAPMEEETCGPRPMGRGRRGMPGGPLGRGRGHHGMGCHGALGPRMRERMLARHGKFAEQRSNVAENCDMPTAPVDEVTVGPRAMGHGRHGRGHGQHGVGCHGALGPRMRERMLARRMHHHHHHHRGHGMGDMGHMRGMRGRGGFKGLHHLLREMDLDDQQPSGQKRKGLRKRCGGGRRLPAGWRAAGTTGLEDQVEVEIVDLGADEEQEPGIAQAC